MKKIMMITTILLSMVFNSVELLAETNFEIMKNHYGGKDYVMIEGGKIMRRESYNKNGNIMQLTDREGKFFKVFYDNGNLKSYTKFSGGTMFYDKSGKLLRSVK